MKNIKKIIVVLVTLMMLATMAACGDEKKLSDDGGDSKPNVVDGDKDKPSVDDTKALKKEPDLNNLVDPSEIVWGYQSEESNDRQYWYLDGDKASMDYIMIDDGDLYTVEGGKLIDDPIGMDYDGMHLKTHSKERPYYDLVFTDEMSCYDLTNKKWYLRCDKEKAIDSLVKAPFYAQDKEDTYIEFHKDGTYKSVWEGDVEYESEKWWFEDAYTIVCDDPNYGSTMTYTVNYKKDSWTVVSVENVRVYLPE